MKVVAEHGASIALACLAFQISETCYRYGFVAQIGSFKDSLRESSVITDCHEQLDTDDV